jgi:hypothetical protein
VSRIAYTHISGLVWTEEIQPVAMEAPEDDRKRKVRSQAHRGGGTMMLTRQRC